ncbi:hypothetical protein COO60DRAFT_1125462 [Scenedesmus sp. NREL 46B-D3]|nr:hypothetical protein COO60DRAFT_1125462 [Scenedesmus sp. NREL 46B-D3]
MCYVLCVVLCFVCELVASIMSAGTAACACYGWTYQQRRRHASGFSQRSTRAVSVLQGEKRRGPGNTTSSMHRPCGGLLQRPSAGSPATWRRPAQEHNLAGDCPHQSQLPRGPGSVRAPVQHGQPGTTLRLLQGLTTGTRHEPIGDEDITMKHKAVHGSARPPGRARRNCPIQAGQGCPGAPTPVSTSD